MPCAVTGENVLQKGFTIHAHVQQSDFAQRIKAAAKPPCSEEVMFRPFSRPTNFLADVTDDRGYFGVARPDRYCECMQSRLRESGL